MLKIIWPPEDKEKGKRIFKCHIDEQAVKENGYVEIAVIENSRGNGEKETSRE